MQGATIYAANSQHIARRNSTADWFTVHVKQTNKQQTKKPKQLKAENQAPDL